MTNYIVTSTVPKWSFLNGYSCNSEDKGHFIRHLGYRFSKHCSMYDLNTAHDSGDIHIVILKSGLVTESRMSRPRVIDQYWGEYSYILEIDSGTAYEAIIEKRQFVNDIEANQWLDTHK